MSRFESEPEVFLSRVRRSVPFIRFVVVCVGWAQPVDPNRLQQIRGVLKSVSLAGDGLPPEQQEFGPDSAGGEKSEGNCFQKNCGGVAQVRRRVVCDAYVKP